MFLASAALWSPTASGISIGTIQGPGHRSALEGRRVLEVPGVVTGIREAAGRHGFWMEAPEEDGDPATSEGIFVRTGELPPQVASGDRVTVTGTVREAEPRGGGLPITILEVEALVDIRRREGETTLPPPVVLGPADRSIPAGAIDDDGMESFDPATDALDFWEALEGMRVRIPEALVIGATTGYGGLSLLPEGGRDVEGPRTFRDGLLLESGDPNPERIQAVVDPASEAPLLGTGDRFRGSATGIVTYAFGTYQVRLVRKETLRILRTERKRDTTELLRKDDRLTVATYNVLNLSAADGEERFRRLASSVVRDLGAPDVVALQEIQDDSGPADDGTVRAEQTLDRLVAAIRDTGGPSYRWLQIDPVDNADGGQPGGNIRVAYLVDPSRMEVPDRPPGDARRAVELEEARDGTVHLDHNPGRIEPGHRCFGAWESEGGSRKPLALETRFRGSPVFFVNLHLTSKGGDDPLFGLVQPPVRHTEPRRLCQARVVADFLEGLLRGEPDARVVVLGDFNEFEFRPP
ncbi:MAG: endonuclease/exonuclease/phosphatase family protein, partial [Thermoanaerobaculia bacterium]|nr:endonuclease/exonuclease/phosphatase family protein [Thermoanaerobaculia bacterium]